MWCIVHVDKDVIGLEVEMGDGVLVHEGNTIDKLVSQ